MGICRDVGCGPRLRVGGMPWPAVRTAALLAWQRVRGRHLLTGTSWEVLEQITRLQWVHAANSDLGGAWAVPSELWLAGRVSMGREAVSDAVCVLAAHGLLVKVRRRPVHGRWQTNLYRLSTTIAAFLIRSLRRRAVPAGVVSPILPRGELSEAMVSHGKGGLALGGIVGRWMERGGALV